MRGDSDAASVQEFERDPQKFYAIDDKGRRIVFVAPRLWLDVAQPDVLAAKLNGRVVQLPRAVKTVVVTVRGVRPASSA